MDQATQELTGSAITDAMFSDRDRGADHAAPAAAPVKQDEPKAQPAPDAQTAPAPAASGSDDPGFMIPKGRLDAEAAKRREAERLNDELNGRLSAYEQQMRQILASQQTAQHSRPQNVQPQQPQQAPDPVVDPQGFQTWVERSVEARVAAVQRQAHDQFLNMSEFSARRAFGDQAVNDAMQFAQRNNVLGAFAQYPDPYGTLVQWHQQQQVIAQVGNDPAAYAERLRQEGAQRALEGLKKGQGNGQPQQQPRFPTSLADQTSASVNVGAAPQSDSAMINAAFAHDRNRRAF
jgi:hypothetical protein